MDPVGIRVEGARELRKIAKRVAGPDSKRLLTTEHKSAAKKVAETASGNVNSRTGRLKRTVRGLGSQTKASVAAGRGPVNDYAGVNHYGGYNNIEPNQYLTDAVASRYDDIYGDLENGYERIARKLATT